MLLLGEGEFYGPYDTGYEGASGIVSAGAAVLYSGDEIDILFWNSDMKKGMQKHPPTRLVEDFFVW